MPIEKVCLDSRHLEFTPIPHSCDCIDGGLSDPAPIQSASLYTTPYYASGYYDGYVEPVCDECDAEVGESCAEIKDAEAHKKAAAKSNAAAKKAAD